MMTTTSNPINFDYVNNTLLTALDNREQRLRIAIDDSGRDPSTAKLLALQQEIQMWTMLTTLQSTVIKEIADASKSVIQKSG